MASMNGNALSDSDLAAIECRERHATPGPWVILNPESPEDFDGPYPKWRGVEADRPDAVIVPKCQGEGYTDSILNADFIAAARQDVPRLVVEVRRLRDERVRLRSSRSDLLHALVDAADALLDQWRLEGAPHRREPLWTAYRRAKDAAEQAIEARAKESAQ